MQKIKMMKLQYKKEIKMKSRTALLMLIVMLLTLFSAGEALAQEQDNTAAQANNPLANMTAFNIQQYFIPELTDLENSANQFWLRYATPFSISKTNWLLRASLPINSFPTAPNGDSDTGLGDFNAFAAWLIDMGNPAVSFGIGPQITIPTATDDDLGSEKWSAGFANVLFDGRSPKFQYGMLLTWQASFAGDDDREEVNVAAFQPFVFYQLGNGTYLRSTYLCV